MRLLYFQPINQYSWGYISMLKRLFPVIIAVLILIGVGCFFSPYKSVSVLEQLPAPTHVEVADLLAVTDLWNEQERLLIAISADGSVEEIYVPSSIIFTFSTGTLVKIGGTRDFSTGIISARTLEVINGANIIVSSPKSGAVVTSPLIVFGFSRTFEAAVNWRIKDLSGNILDEGYDMSAAQDIGQFGPFRLEIFLPVIAEKDFILEVFEYSMKDGSDLSLISLPLVLLNTETTDFDIYFTNNTKVTNNCRQLYPVSRKIALTSAVGRAAVLDLLKGPTTEEKKLGYRTAIPESTSLLSLAVGEKQTWVNFNSLILSGWSGTCRAETIRAQIAQTLVQFPYIGDVILSVDGNVEKKLTP